ncbi:MAG: pilus assembly protein PilM [Minisyncoccia bacterium]
MQFSRTLARWFPVPKLLAPPAAGVDITDASVKWLSFKEGTKGLRISSCGNQPIPQHLVERGAVRDAQGLSDVLKDVKKKSGLSFAHAALPEEDAYVFNMTVPLRSSRTQIMNMIEFELEARVPIPPNQAVYDYDTVLMREGENEEIAVSVFPRDLAEGYTEAFSRAGIELLSLEIEARSIARAISKKEHTTAMLVDCGHARTGVAILKQGIPIFTSTIDIGGQHLSKAIIDTLGISEEDARVFKNEHGLVLDDPSKKAAFDALEKVAASLAEEIGRHYRFWDTRRDEKGVRAMPVEEVFLLGGSANLRGFSEYIAGKVHAPAERPNVWQNAFSFDDYIPAIDQRTSLQYATAIGLALRST